MGRASRGEQETLPTLHSNSMGAETDKQPDLVSCYIHVERLPAQGVTGVAIPASHSPPAPASLCAGSVKHNTMQRCRIEIASIAHPQP